MAKQSFARCQEGLHGVVAILGVDKAAGGGRSYASHGGLGAFGGFGGLNPKAEGYGVELVCTRGVGG